MKNKRRFIIGTVAIILSLAIVSTAFATDTDQIPEGFTGVYTTEDLNRIREDLDGNYILMNDIVFELSDFTEGGAYYNDGDGWDPIGSDDSYFNGILDGNGYTIRNLTITSQYPGYYGLFSHNNGTIKNLGLVNTSISADVTEVPETGLSSINVGSIAGNNMGTITSCYNTGEISSNCRLDERGSAAGGIVCGNTGIIENCYNAASVSACRTYKYSNSAAGGIAANTNKGTVMHCYNIGMVSVGYSGYTNAIAYGIANEMRSPSIGTCYSIDYVQDERRTSKHYDATYISDEKMRTASTFEGFDFDNTWVMDAGSGYPYPQLRSAKHTASSNQGSPFESGSGTPNDPYIIKTAQQLQAVNDHLGAYYRLDADIDFSTYETKWQPIGSSKCDAFFGMFDGSGHVIKNIDISEYSEYGTIVGIFGYNDGIISNLGTVNGTVKLHVKNQEGNLSQDYYVGGLAAQSSGLIQHCYNTNTVILEDTESINVFSGAVGGICGDSQSELSMIRDSYNTGDVYVNSKRGYIHDAGICGDGARIENCYNIGRISLKCATSADAMSIGAGTAKMKNCYTMSISLYGNSNIDDAVCLEEGQMLIEKSFEGFDFDNVWEYANGSSYAYPALKNVGHVDTEENFEEFAGGRGTKWSPYIINTANQLKNIELYPAEHFALEADISLADEDWEPICENADKPFKGRIDGNGHTITGLNIVVDTGEEYVGLFGYTSGKIESLIVKNSTITVSEGFTGSVYIGVVAGYQDSTGAIRKCRLIDADISIITEGSSAYPHIGGAVGGNYRGLIKDVSVDGSINVDYIGTTYGLVGGITGINDDGEIASCYNSAPITGYIDKTKASELYWAGIAGINRGSVDDVFNTADILVEKGEEAPSYPRVAGIIAKNDPFHLKILNNAYNTGQVKYGNTLYTPVSSGEEYEAKNTYYTFGKYDSHYIGTKLTEEELKNPGSLAGFDFDAVWTIAEGEGGYPYPQLKSIPYNTETINKSLTDSYVIYEDLYAHTYDEIKPEADVFYAKELLKEGIDYEVRYENNIDPGKGSMTFTGKGQYVGAKTVSFTIKDYDISHMDVKLGNTTLTYTGSERTPQVLIDGLYEGSNFTVTFEDNINVGTAKATIEGKGKYFGTVVKTFEIVPAQVKASSIVIPANTFSYTGEPIEPEVSIYKLTKDKDYTVTYSNNIEAGTATITVEGKGNYTGTASKDFVIEPADASDYEARLLTTNYTYDGKKKTPLAAITAFDGKDLIEGTDYTLEYDVDNYKIGKHNVVINYIGNYAGSNTLYFEIGPKNPEKLGLVLYGHDDVKVSWSKVTGASGYKVYCKKSTVSNYTHLKTTTSNYLKAAGFTDGVKYNFKVVAYKKVDGNICENAGKIKSIYTLKKLPAPTVSKSGTKVKVMWTNINGESGYQISKSTSKTKTNIVYTYKTTTGTYKTIKADKGKKYYYKVRAYNSASGKKVYGPWSEVKAYRR